MRILLCCLLLVATSINAQKIAYGGKLKPEQANMDIQHYNIVLTVDLANKSIAGYTDVDMILKQPANVILLDLVDSLQVQQVWVNGKVTAFTHNNNLINITSATPFAAGDVVVKVRYGGKPMIAKRPPWDDGFTFTQDSLGNPWMAITAEGTGAKIYIPCKDHPSDEPDKGVDMQITVPEGLTVAGPGLLVQTKTRHHQTTFHWKTNYPINNYSILFNVGSYTVVARNYTTVNGNNVPMQFYVLKYHAALAPHHLELLENMAHVKEKYFGEFPWAKEKIGIVETPHLGMEHQTMNAYGNKFRYTKIGGQDFDGLMNHEFGHEWWGNKVTAADWADYWIHEGIGSYGDALYTYDKEGEQAYEGIFKHSIIGIKNDKPIVIGKDIEEEEAYHGDIYSKGAFFMHTLRYVLGDSIFFPTLKKLATDSQYTYHNLIGTIDVQQLFSKSSGIDLAPLFHLYIYTTDKLMILVKQVAFGKYLIQLQNIDMPLPLDIATNTGTQKLIVDKKGVTVSSTTMPLIDTNVFYIKEVVYE